MRPLLLLPLVAAVAGATPVLAQSADRYGGVGAYAGPVQPGIAAPPARVLSWPGKSVPTGGPPQVGGYGYPRYVQAQPAYGAQLQPAPYAQGRGAPPASYAGDRRAELYPTPAGYAPTPAPGYYPAPGQAYPQQQGRTAPVAAYPSSLQPQPYYAPAPGAPPPAPGSTATAPSGVYPANTVPPQLAYPMAVPPQMGQPMVAQPQPPNSIYAPPQAAAQPARPNPTDPRQPQMMAMNQAAPTGQGARLYSLHRQFGMQPDPTPPLSHDQGQAVELVSAIDSGVAPDPAAEDGATVRTRQTDSKGNTVTRTAQLRGTAQADN